LDGAYIVAREQSDEGGRDGGSQWTLNATGRSGQGDRGGECRANGSRSRFECVWTEGYDGESLGGRDSLEKEANAHRGDYPSSDRGG